MKKENLNCVKDRHKQQRKWNNVVAHVMSYKELKKVQPKQIVFEEVRHLKYKIYTLYYNGLDFTNGKHYLLMEECDENRCPDYNWNYRVWNEMPTEKEMDNAPWKEDPYV